MDNSLETSLALTNGRVILPNRVADDLAVVIDRSMISALVEPDRLSPDVERLDVGKRYIAPGLIDLHTHGALGHTFNEPDAAAFDAILGENLRRGVTSLLATIGAAPAAAATRAPRQFPR